ncbi:MAG: response regulator [Janthinobacterium lividum]
MIRVLLAEDHNVVRNGIKSLLEKENDLQVVAEAINGKHAVELLEKGLQVDVILADINMPQMNGIEMIACVKSKFSEIKVIVLSHFELFRYSILLYIIIKIIIAFLFQ